MSAPVPSSREAPDPLTFGVFEFCSATLELKRNGDRIRLQEIPARLLNALLRNPGQLGPRTISAPNSGHPIRSFNSTLA